MAVKSADQITIVDLTDGYSVGLTADAFSLLGDSDGKVATATTLTTAVQVYKGTTALTSSDVTIGTITTITGVTATKSGLTVTLTVGTTCVGGEISIPITISGGISFTKKVSISVAKTGQQGIQGVQGEQGEQGKQGEQGIQGVAGADAVTIVITSDNGTIFKNNTGSTTLTAHVFVGGVEKEITNAGAVADNLGTIYWYKDGTKVTSPSKTLAISASIVTNKMVVSAQLEG